LLSRESLGVISLCKTIRIFPPKVVADLANPAVQRELQAFIDGLDKFPAAGAPDEYAALFEEAYPNEGDRRTSGRLLEPTTNEFGGRISLNWIARWQRRNRTDRWPSGMGISILIGQHRRSICERILRMRIRGARLSALPLHHLRPGQVTILGVARSLDHLA
jgi:hypothetical protein